MVDENDEGTSWTIVNTRAEQQFKILAQRVSFEDRGVIDFGCGYGDLLYLIKQAGANTIGVNKSSEELKAAIGKGLVALYEDLDKTFASASDGIEETFCPHDIGICFSVLPYLKDPIPLLFYMFEECTISFIECQYAGDGPGFDCLKNDEDMENWLKTVGWLDVKAIGKTYISDRDKWRTIWMCQ